MIAWINGTFGVGKTTTANALVARSPQLRLFDPEWVGSMLAHNLADREFGDFQQVESWRRLTPVVADEIIRATGQSLVTVQTVMTQGYWDELVSGLSDRGHEVLHVVLETGEATLRERINADEIESGARDWRLRHLATYADQRTWMTQRADLVIATTRLNRAQPSIRCGRPSPGP